MLCEMLERAGALESGSDPKATLERAFARGVVFLEAAGGGGVGIPRDRPRPGVGPWLRGRGSTSCGIAPWR